MRRVIRVYVFVCCLLCGSAPSFAGDDAGRQVRVLTETQAVAHTGTRRLGDGSIGRVEEKAAIRARKREECSFATPGVAAEVSIHVFPGRRRTARRSDR